MATPKIDSLGFSYSKNLSIGEQAYHLREFFGLETEIFCYKNSYATWKFPIYSIAFENILAQEKDFKIERACSANDYDLAMTKEKFNDRFILSCGMFLIKNKDKKFAVEFEYRSNSDIYENRFDLSFYFTKDSEKDAEDFLNKVHEYGKQNNIFRFKSVTPDGKFLDVGNLTWSDLIVEEDIKKKLEKNIYKIIKNQDAYKKEGIPIRRGLLLSGQAGSGKTMTLKILSNELKDKVTFLWVSSKDIRGAWDIANIYELAREASPTIVAFEDVDLFLKDRETGNDSSILGEMLNCLDGIVPNDGVITIMTTNYPEKIEKALKDRPGRFDVSISYKNPTQPLKLKMYKKLFNGCVCKFDFEALSKKGENFTGAHITEVIIYSKMLCIDEESYQGDKLLITENIINRAVDSVSKSFRVRAPGTGFGFNAAEEVGAVLP